MPDLDMGKYAFYVWGAYGVTAAVLIGLALMSLRAHRAQAAKLKALQASLAAQKEPVA